MNHCRDISATSEYSGTVGRVFADNTGIHGDPDAMSHPGSENDAGRDQGGDEVIYTDPAGRKLGNRPTTAVKTWGKSQPTKRLRAPRDPAMSTSADTGRTQLHVAVEGNSSGVA